MREFVPLYLLLINAAAFVFMYADKQFAKKKHRRIPEATLLTLAAIGGGLGALAGMFLFHHKTRKARFLILVPLFLTLQIVGSWLLLFFRQ